MNETLVYLPFNTRVFVQGFTDSSAKQRAVFTPKVGQPFTLSGVGSNYVQMGSTYVLTTPAPEPGETGFLVKVQIEHGEPGQASRMVQGRHYSIAALNMIGIASEDWNDEDWNDCTVLFTWSTPIPGAADAGPEEEEEEEEEEEGSG